MTARSGEPKRRVLRPALPPAILGAIILVVGALLVGSDWFSTIRFAVSILALITAVIAAQHRQWWWGLPLLPIAVLWNPVWPFELPEGVWMTLHYAAGLVFLVVGAFARVRDEG